MHDNGAGSKLAVIIRHGSIVLLRQTEAGPLACSCPLNRPHFLFCLHVYFAAEGGSASHGKYIFSIKQLFKNGLFNILHFQRGHALEKCNKDAN